MEGTVLSPTDFVALLNQTLEFAYPVVTIEGELANFKVSKNRWVYFDLKDDISSVRFFGNVYQLPGPLSGGLSVQVIGSPRLHPRFGFSVNFRAISAVGEGSIKKAADLLQQKLEAEGLFALERKRALPLVPQTIGLITAADSAAAADFIKILNERWGGVEITLADSLVQGEQAPLQLVQSLEYFNQLPKPPDVIAMVRGGGSAEDLAAFSDERVVRAVAASRVPTIVAIGHETDISLAELAADQRASTPTNAAQVVVPDKKHQLEIVRREREDLTKQLKALYVVHQQLVEASRLALSADIKNVLSEEYRRLESSKNLTRLLDPSAVLSRGYAIVSSRGRYIMRAAQIKPGDSLQLSFSDGKIQAIAKGPN
ncbi:MAG: Exodeoxyribonuclease 7 large subunit [Candidatus Saccharibacteria bacterium]|nr:Exodeoxyribonuclease 7 large subunit [Candidatus Saccharibacteria bacterium]